MKHRILLSLAAALLLAACSAPKADVPVYVWHMIGNNTPLDSLQKDFQAWKSHGVTGVCIETLSMEQIEQVAALAHREGLEYHAWIPSMLRSGMPHEWYAVNRLGQSADMYPSYANTYRFLDPANPEVKEFLTQQYMTVASIPNVDYVRLDFMRYPDVILASGLGELYGLQDVEGEYAPADYCYCENCVRLFKEQTGIDITEVEDPSQVPQWAQFRCDQITLFVDKVARAVHQLGKKVSVDVFPGPTSYAEHMVRQQWNQWMVDMFFPMNYNDFYGETPDWITGVVKEEVQAAGTIPVMSGLRTTLHWRENETKPKQSYFGLGPDELKTAILKSLEAGATGVCLFKPSRMEEAHWTALEEALAEYKAK